MANAIYDKARQGFEEKAIDWLNDTIKVMGVDLSLYTFSQAHQFLSDVAAGARLATATLAGKSDLNGVLDSTDPTITGGWAAGKSAGLIVYQDTGVAATSRLLLYYDTGTGLPIPGNGNDVAVTWDNTAGTLMAKV